MEKAMLIIYLQNLRTRLSGLNKLPVAEKETEIKALYAELGKNIDLIEKQP